MTGVPGIGVGRMLPTLSDEKVDAIKDDLKGYIDELRSIPRNISSGFPICNVLGGGILDWRIGNSQREVLRFRDEASFNQYLTHDLAFDEQEIDIVAKPHRLEHEIVLTHADLNMRNILVDSEGKICGIVDCECAGYFPGYWEYTKMHFTIRVSTRWIADVIEKIFSGYQNELMLDNLLVSRVPPW